MRKTGRAGTHSSVIDAAADLVPALEKLGRVSRGVILANARASGRSIKALPLDGGWRITVVAKNARQEFHAYGISLVDLRRVLQSPDFRSFTLNLPEN